MLSFKDYLIESCNCWKGYKRKPGTKPCAEGSCVKEETELDEAATADAKGYKSKTGGLTQKGRDHFNSISGGHLKAPVTTPPSKLKAGCLLQPLDSHFLFFTSIIPASL